MGVIKDFQRAIAAIPRPTRRRCVICRNRVGRFLPYRGGDASPSLMRALGIVGSDIDNFECPRCGAHDRERHLLMYLEASGLAARIPAMRILHFAPERHIAQCIAAWAPVEYVKCDLHPSAIDVRPMDIEAMPYGDGSFDLLIANHVLEHVDDDERALAEIHRVLTPGGMAILQTPYSPILHRTWRDPGIVDESSRREAYGQEDHLRLYGRDIFERFASSGLTPCIFTHEAILPGREPGELGVNPREPFFLFRRET